jgi:RNA polymerase sigma-70 factor (ECF subfamily)
MAASDLDDFDGFYSRTYPSAYRLALGITGSKSAAEDATQDAYLSAYRRRRSYRGDGPPEAWLRRIVANAAIDHCRRLQRHAATGAPDDVYTLPDDRLESTPQRLALAAAIRALPPRQRAAVLLHYLHGYPHGALGELLGMSEGAAAMTLHRALTSLRASLGPQTTAGSIRGDRNEEA